MRKKLFFLLLLLSLIILLIVLVPLQLPYKITTAGKILPAKSWIVSKGNSGQLISFLNNREKGIIDNYSVKEFERGDDINLLLNPDMSIGKHIAENDTIGFIYSNELEKQIALLKSEINVARASLELNIAGEKESIIKEAEENMNYYLTQASEQKKILGRQKALYQKNLISKEEYELTLNQAELNDISIAIARARLESVSTGAKKEQIELINNEIKSLQKQIEVLQKRYTSNYLISPISGVVSNFSAGDTLFTISDNSSFVVVMPVKLSDISFIHNNSEIEFKQSKSSEKLKGNIIFIDNSAMKLNSDQIVFAVASVRADSKMAYGLLTECVIDGGSISLYEHFKRLMNKNIF
jgi:hypothetical protein